MIWPAQREDAASAARIFLAARADRRWFPPPAHADDTVVAFITGRIAAADHAWIADPGEGSAGFAVLHEEVLEHLYVVPERQRRGIGSALITVAKAAAPAGFSLRCFARNLPALAFYAQHGCVVVEETDGAGNEEREPDRLLVWRP